MDLIASAGKGSDAARLAVIAAFAALIACVGAFSLPPLDRDEARFAQASAQMLETGDYIAIRFQDAERNKKPAGVYWLQSASVSLLSSPEARAIYAYRLPSVIAAILAALFTYAIGRRMFGPAPAFLAAMLLAASPVFAAEATIAKTDAALLACVVAAQAALSAIFLNQTKGRRRLVAAGFWIALGAGVLIKGPIILLVCGLTALVFWAGRRREIRLADLTPVTGLIILTLMIGPWALAVNEATEGRFFIEAVGRDMLAKTTGAQESHGGPPGYYLALTPILLWPAAALIPSALTRAIVRRREPVMLFLLAWLAPSWIVFELTATKLPHYVLPLFPALALLAADAAFTGARGQASRLDRAGAALYLLFGAALSLGVAAIPFAFNASSLTVYAIIAALGVFAVSVIAASAFWRGRRVEGGFLAALASSGLALALLGGVLPNLDALKVSSRLSTAIAAAGMHPLRDGAPPVILSGYNEPSAIFLLGTNTQLLDGDAAAKAAIETGAAVAVESRQAPAFEAGIADARIALKKFAVIDGFNYSNGKHVSIAVYRRASDIADRTNP